MFGNPGYFQPNIFVGNSLIVGDGSIFNQNNGSSWQSVIVGAYSPYLGIPASPAYSYQPGYVAVGLDAGWAASGQGSIAIGSFAMQGIQLPITNSIAIGQRSMQSAKGSPGIGLGIDTLKNNTTGANNIAIGNAAGKANLTGVGNVYIGDGRSSLGGGGGSYNTIVGDMHIAGDGNIANYCTVIGAQIAAPSINQTIFIGTGDGLSRLNFDGTGLNWNFTPDGTNTSFRVGQVANAVNFLTVVNSTTGTFPSLASAGNDANIGFAYSTKGNSAHQFYTNAFGSIQFQITHTASAVNRIGITGAAASASPGIASSGNDTNIGIVYATKGSGAHYFQVNGSNQALVTSTANAVNQLNITGSATGNNIPISASGSDVNIGITIAQKGTAVFGMTGQTTATTIGAAGGAAALPATPLGYLQLTINGTSCKIPYYNP